MPIRFWKSFSLGKGLRMNVSRRGIGLSQKIGNVTLNTSGRTSVNIPGTGITAYSQTGRSRKKSQTSVQMWVALILGFAFVMCCICIGFYILISPTTDNLNTPTPIIANTELSPVILSTATSSSNNPIFIATSTVTLLPAPTLAPTWTPEPTFTPFVLSTLPIVTSPSTSACSCSSDQYDCKDFASQSAAQACFNACVAAGMGDIHRLEGDNNGIACESN